MLQDVEAATHVDTLGKFISVSCYLGLGVIFAAVGGLHFGPVVVAAAIGEAVAVRFADVQVVVVSRGLAQAAAAQPRLQEVPLLADGIVVVIFC